MRVTFKSNLKSRLTLFKKLGCEYHGYTSDITRTWPINGRFSPQQRELYEALSIVQSELIKQCSNMPSLDVLFDSMCRLLGKELQQLGLISKSTSDNNLLKVRVIFKL